MDLSENQFTARMSGGSRHETPPSLSRRVDAILAEIDEALEPHPTYPSYELEKELGHKVLTGEITAQEAYDLLDPVKSPPSEA